MSPLPAIQNPQYRCPAEGAQDCESAPSRKFWRQKHRLEYFALRERDGDKLPIPSYFGEEYLGHNFGRMRLLRALHGVFPHCFWRSTCGVVINQTPGTFRKQAVPYALSPDCWPGRPLDFSMPPIGGGVCWA